MAKQPILLIILTICKRLTLPYSFISTSSYSSTVNVPVAISCCSCAITSSRFARSSLPSSYSCLSPRTTWSKAAAILLYSTISCMMFPSLRILLSLIFWLFSLLSLWHCLLEFIAEPTKPIGYQEYPSCLYRQLPSNCHFSLYERGSSPSFTALATRSRCRRNDSD